jgi:regulator of ribosome biosynthesis
MPLPRAKPLPKPKPPTKWERFARAKGIQSRRRDRKAWDEEGQAWVARWGWKGKNKAEETQWLHEVPANAGASYSTHHISPIFLVSSLSASSHSFFFLEGKVLKTSLCVL